MPKPDTKEKILQIGSDLIHRKGFHYTGLQEILQAAGVPKGSFYNYFKSKEDFGLQVIDYFAQYFDTVTKDYLEDRSIPPLKRIERVLDFFMEYFKSEEFTRGCPVGNLSQEMADISPAFRHRLKNALDAMVGAYAKVLIEAQIKGDIPEELDVREAAYFIVSSWHGALIRMKIEKSADPLENHKIFIFESVLKSS